MELPSYPSNPWTGKRQRLDTPSAHHSGLSGRKDGSRQTISGTIPLRPVYQRNLDKEIPPDKFVHIMSIATTSQTPIRPKTAPTGKVQYSAKHYTPSEEVVDFIKTWKGIPPVSLSAELRQWHSDNWNGFIDLPSDLKVEYFIRCIPDNTTNMEAQRKTMIAANNLYMAKELKRLKHKGPFGSTKGWTFKVPYPSVTPDVEYQKSLNQLPELVHKFNDQSTMFMEAMNLARTAI